MKSSVLLSLGCTLLLSACATASIAPSESQPSAQATPQITPTPSPSASETTTPTLPTPTPLPSFGPTNPKNPCPDFHLTPQNLDLPVEKISNAPQALNAMCSSPATGDLYLLTDTEVFHFDIKSQQAQKIFENSPDFKELVTCTVDNQENVYLADQGSQQLIQYNNTNKRWTELESNINGFSLLKSSRYLSLHMSPQQELFIFNPNGSRVYYYNQDLKLQLFNLNYHSNAEKFDTNFHRKQFAERNLNTIENTLMPGPLSIAFGPRHLFMSSGSGWFEMFSIELTSGTILTLPPIEQRGKNNFGETLGNIALSGAGLLSYSSRYRILFHVLSGNPSWTSPETGCWQQLSNNITARDLTDGGDGHLYIIDSSTKTLHRIKLSPEIFKSPATQTGSVD